MSVRKLDEGLYYMEYKGDDGFAGLMESGGGRTASELVDYVLKFLSKGYYTPPTPTPAEAVYGCSALTVRTPGEYKIGVKVNSGTAVAYRFFYLTVV